MKLGMITSPNAAGIERVNSFGLQSAEFDINIGCDIAAFEAEIPAIVQSCQTTGVEVGAIGRWGSDRVSQKGVIEEEFQNECRLIDGAAKLGAKVYIGGCNAVEGNSLYQNAALAIEYMGRLIDYARPKGAKVCTYNCHWNTFLDSDPAWSLVHGQLPELGIKFDPSHSFYAGRDYLGEMVQWGDRFYHFHVKGALKVNGQRVDDPPAGLDSLNWNEIMGILYAKKYDGVLSIEPHSETWQGELGDRGVRYTVDYIRSKVLG